ncbi:unnamed protein product [Arctogadus glacialis]
MRPLQCQKAAVMTVLGAVLPDGCDYTQRRLLFCMHPKDTREFLKERQMESDRCSFYKHDQKKKQLRVRTHRPITPRRSRAPDSSVFDGNPAKSDQLTRNLGHPKSRLLLAYSLHRFILLSASWAFLLRWMCD